MSSTARNVGCVPDAPIPRCVGAPADPPCTKSEHNAAEIVRKLRQKLEDRKRRRAVRAGWTRRFVPTGVAALDAVLPHGGLPCGAITEILFDGPGFGSMSLAMRIAARCSAAKRGAADHLSKQQSVVIVDTLGDFYPPAACAYGIALDRLFVIRVKNLRDAFWAVDQSLRCQALASVIAPLAGLDERQSRRLQLAAESSGCVGLILRPVPQRAKSFAAVRMHVQSVARQEVCATKQVHDPDGFAQVSRHHHDFGLDGGSQTVGALSTGERPRGLKPTAREDVLHRISLLKVREGMPVELISVDLQHETGALPLPPLPVDRAMAKAG